MSGQVTIEWNFEHRYHVVTLPNGEAHTFNRYNSSPGDAEGFAEVKSVVLGAPVVRVNF